MDFYYSGDTYDTPTDYKRVFYDKISFGSRAYFVYRMLMVIIKSHNVIKRNNGVYSNESWSKCSYFVFRSVENTGTKIHIRGLDNILKTSGAVVFIGNHMSTLETFLLPGLLCPRKASSFIVKKELMECPVFGTTMRATQSIAVGRSNPFEDLKNVLNEGTAVLNSGRSIVVFPQKTRSADFKPEEFNSIGVKLAKKAGVPIIPIAIKTDFWGNGKIIKDFGKVDRKKDVYISFGEPITVEGNGKDAHEKIISYIMCNLEKWKTIYP